MNPPTRPQALGVIHSIAKPVVELVFYGNYFYGFCAVSIMLETASQLKLRLDGPLIYALAFLATTLFYNHPYLKNISVPNGNPRTMWFIRNGRFMVMNQIISSLLLLAGMLHLCLSHLEGLKKFGPLSWLLLLIFPLTGAFYYGSNRVSSKFNLRQIGFLKPFLIGFVWAGLANVYPILYADLIHAQPFELDFFRGLLFIKTFMYISMLAIMFDIKDYSADQASRLKTWIVKIGIQKTLSHVIVPLTILGILTFIVFAIYSHFSPLKIILILIPFLLLIAATKLFGTGRSLLFYLIVIDGLLIVKAFFGILASYF